MFEAFKKLKQKALDFGRSSEKKAEKFLKKKGYKIIETNYRCKTGEIDIVAKDGKYIVFCEVKARRNRNYGSALESVTPSKIRKVRLAAEDFLTKRRMRGNECRFDILTIDIEDGKENIELIPNAF